MAELKYNAHRKHRYYSQDHPPTAKQRRLIRRRDRVQAANNRDASFGKINWQAYDHKQLYDMIYQADPGSLGDTAHQWAELAAKSDSATSAVHDTVQKLLLSWQGASAVQAASSASKLTSWAAGASSTMRDVGDGLDTYTGAIVQARNAIPEPVYYAADRQFREGYDVKASGPDAAIMADQLLDDHLPSKNEATKAKAEAVRVMERYEHASKGVHDKLPTFKDTPRVAVGSFDEAGGGQDGDGSSQASGPAPDATIAASAGAGIPGADGTAGAVGAAGSGYGGAGVLGGVAGPGVGGGAALGGGALSGGGMSAAKAGPAGSTGAAAAAVQAGRGTAGTTGFFPPGAGGKRGAGDGEHKNRYAGESGLDLYDDLAPAYPPVLGE